MPYSTPKLATAFSALEELLLAGTLGAARGMVSLWSQRRGQLLACSRAAAAPVIHVWDMATERCVQRLLSGLEGANQRVTALGELGGGHSEAVLASGSSDGSIRLYDCRAGYTPMAVLSEHRHSIIGLCSQPEGESGGEGGSSMESIFASEPEAALVSADSSGEIKIWDVRTWAAISAADTTKTDRTELSCLALHNSAPVRAPWISLARARAARALGS
jgi:WD40 repeat protein